MQHPHKRQWGGGGLGTWKIWRREVLRLRDQVCKYTTPIWCHCRCTVINMLHLFYLKSVWKQKLEKRCGGRRRCRVLSTTHQKLKEAYHPWHRHHFLCCHSSINLMEPFKSCHIYRLLHASCMDSLVCPLLEVAHKAHEEVCEHRSESCRKASIK